MGHWIEPAIRPLGFDWKIGIALIEASFAAREVFVGTVATIYSSHDDGENTEKLSVLLSKQINPKILESFQHSYFSFAIMFYMFAMQCLSTVAVVKRRPSWEMANHTTSSRYTLLAYLASLLTYNLLAG